VLLLLHPPNDGIRRDRRYVVHEVTVARQFLP
jgi:hypothetical protein